MKSKDYILEVNNLSTTFFVDKKAGKAVDDVSFSLKRENTRNSRRIWKWQKRNCNVNYEASWKNKGSRYRWRGTIQW